MEHTPPTELEVVLREQLSGIRPGARPGGRSARSSALPVGACARLFRGSFAGLWSHSKKRTTGGLYAVAAPPACLQSASGGLGPLRISSMLRVVPNGSR